MERWPEPRSVGRAQVRQVSGVRDSAGQARGKGGVWPEDRPGRNRMSVWGRREKSVPETNS